MTDPSTTTCYTCGTKCDGICAGQVFHSLRAVVFYDTSDGYWYAQGLDLDLTAHGESEDAAKSNFAKNLTLSAKATLHRFGSVDGLFHFHPQDSERYKHFCSIGDHHRYESTKIDIDGFPFSRITFKTATLFP